MSRTGETLSAHGPIVITDRAARELAEGLPAAGQPPRTLEGGREWLAEYLKEARQVRTRPRIGATQWRRRSRPLALDIAAMVSIEEDRAVVTHVSVRAYERQRPRRR